MPIFYSVSGEKSWDFIFSKSLLVQNMEPDFSMPFNVNAVTNALIGLLFINTYNTLVKPSRFLKLNWLTVNYIYNHYLWITGPNSIFAHPSSIDSFWVFPLIYCSCYSSSAIIFYSYLLVSHPIKKNANSIMTAPTIIRVILILRTLLSPPFKRVDKWLADAPK